MKAASNDTGAPEWPAAVWWATGVAFAVLATANAAGYRFGTSDQAFHVPAVVRVLDPAAFPRDASLIDAQGHLMLADDAMAWFVQTMGISLDVAFFGAYLLSLALFWCGTVLIGQHAYGSPWLTMALGAALTLRHRIPRTSANSFEPYYSPRMVTFALGLCAIAAVQRRRHWLAIGLIALGALVHVTTAVWFAILLGVTIAILDTTLRRLVVPSLVAVGLFLGWALWAGPLESSLGRMDDVWLQALVTKDSLFAVEWPIWAWLVNLGALGALWAAVVVRRRRGEARPVDKALAWGSTALVLLFLLTLPLVAARLVLPVQLQISRIFWLVDVLATVQLVGLVRGGGARRALAVALVALSVVRAGYVTFIEHPERALFGVTLDGSPWQEAMSWIATQPPDVHVLADPGHAWKYETSVRVAAGRDVFLEEVKDSALAIYSRDVAQRVVDRTQAVGDFSALTAERARQLAKQYGLDLLVTENDLALPLAHRNEMFRIYRLR